MYLDDLLKLADAQTGTIGIASTSHVDQLARAEIIQPGAIFYVRIDTAFVATGDPYAIFSLHTAQTTFDDAVTLVTSATLQAATLVAGYEIKMPIPVGARRYIRGYMDAGIDAAGSGGINDGNKFTAGAWDMFIVAQAGGGNTNVLA
jgi:hypothetical protein